MKKLHLCLLILLVFSVVSCGGRKTADNAETNDDPDSTTNDEEIAADYDMTHGNDTAADPDETSDDADEDTATDPDGTTGENIPADGDHSTDEDKTGDSDETADEDTTECDLKFTRQPEKMNIAPNGRSVSIVCEAEAPGCEITYQWYESPDSSTNSGTAVTGATKPTFETPVFTGKGIRYYYCTAAASSPTEESKTYISDIASVAYTALPTLYINTPGGVEITSKEEWIKKASVSLIGTGSDLWNFENVETSIKGRGNSTWNRPKKPYALKLKTAREIMGMPAHKRWVLLANYYDGSFMRNTAAIYFSRLFELDWTVHGEFVDLVLNGKYKGLYWLGEAIKVDQNRVDINDGNPEMTDDEDKDYLIEIDLFFDEIIKFKSEIRDLPYMIRNESFMVDENNVITSGGAARLERLQKRINDLEKLLYPDFTVVSDTDNCSAPDESYAEIIDIDSWVKFWLVNEIMDNRELVFPRSSFFTFDSTNNIFKAGPVWDFDQAASHRPATCQLNKKIYYNALFKSPKFVKRTKELWNEYSTLIDIEPQIEMTQSRIKIAARYDAMLWTGQHDYINILLQNDELKKFEEYAEFLRESIRQQILIVNSFIGNLSAEGTDP